MYRFWLAFLFLIFVSVNSNTRNLKKETILGKVVAITDGDTFKLLTQDSILVKVRLANIDCPERKQPFSAKAKQFVSDAIFSKIVIVKSLKKDKYRRHISNVIYDDSLSLAHELIKNGLAWHYKKYSKDSILQTLEDNARQNKLGLWQDKNAIAPWDWRDMKKKMRKKKKQ